MAKSGPNVFCNDGPDELRGLFQPKLFYNSNLSLLFTFDHSTLATQLTEDLGKTPEKRKPKNILLRFLVRLFACVV